MNHIINTTDKDAVIKVIIAGYLFVYRPYYDSLTVYRDCGKHWMKI